MPKNLMKKLEAIKKEIETLRDGANEEDFANSFYYTDFQVGLSNALTKINTTLFNATI